jgi:uncharacterized membrane protein YkoI
MKLMPCFAAVAVLATASLSVVLADRPKTSARPIAEIVGQLEQQGFGPFVEISFDDGYWEVEVYRNDAPYELTVDGRSGKILSEHRDDAEPRPPHDAQPLSQILRQLTSAGYTDIDEISFERRYWEVESLRNGGKHEIHVHPTTGEVINDRLDD